MKIGLGLSLGAAAAIAASLVSSSARADDESGVLDSRHRSTESPQHFELEIRVGPYHPAIDQEPGLNGKTPYLTVFGNDTRYSISAEFDWQVLRIPHFGSIGPGVSVGKTGATAKATRIDNGQPSAEDTSLDIYPMYAVAVARVDVFMREAHIPIVPYAKAGLGFALWEASNTIGTSTYNGIQGRGHTFGTHLAFGGALQLNAFDERAANSLDETTGINNTYLFGEFMMSDLTGIGQTHALYVGTHTVQFGLAFEF